MDTRPIGVFDSGVGGLTVVRELKKIMPQENILYFGDTGRVPYGTRSRQTIRKYAAQVIAWLLQHDVKALVAACGTVSANVTDQDAAKMGVTVPWTGVVLPATRTACAMSAHGRIGVFATPASIRSGAYGKAVREIRPSARVFGAAGTILVPLVESGMIEPDNQITRLAVEMYLKPLMGEKIDTLILGCTHYPLLYDIINETLDYQVTLIDAGAAAAQQIRAMLCETGMRREDETATGETRYFVTDTVESFAAVAQYFLHDEEIRNQTEYVDPDSLTF